MADVKISGLPASTVPLAGTEVLPIVQGGTTKQVSVNNLTAGKTVLAAAFDTDIAAAAVTLSGTTLAADGTDTNINLAITPKGSGGLGINGSPTGDLAGSTLTAKFCVKQDESGPVAGFVKANNSAATPGATVYGCRSRGTLAAPTIVQNGDVLATYLGLGFDGTDLAIAADIEFQVDGTPGSDDMPGRILFKTTPDGTQTPVEALRINSAQVATFAQPIVGSISSLKSNATTGILQVAGPGAGTTRVMTTPDANFTAARTDAAQTFTGAQTFSNGVVTSVADGLKILSGPNTLTQLYYSGGTILNRFTGTSLFIAENGNNQLIVAPTTGDVTVNTGNLVIGTSGKGIDFSATPGTGTSELLADYEEGTWTPGQGAGLTVVGAFSSSGFYTKVGRVVTVSGLLVGGTSIVATNGTTVVTGLPFASNATSTGVVADSAYNNITGARALGSNILAVGTTVAGANLVFSITYQV